MDLVQQLADIEAIKQLKARYFRLIDTKEFDGLADVFAPDALFDSTEATYDPVKGQYPGFEKGATWNSREEILEGVKAAMPPALQSVHMGHTPEVEILSATTAKGVQPFNDRLLIPGVLAANGYGYYYETYEKIDGTWMIKSSVIKRLRVVFDE